MVSGVLALACSSILALQTPVAGEVDPASLTLDALIERIPPRGGEDVKVGDEFHVHPLTAELGRRLQSGVALSGAQWERVLVRTDALRWPRRWLVGVPFAVSARIPGWLRTDTVLFLDPEQAPLRRARVGSFDMGSCAVPWMGISEELGHQELGALPLGRHEITVQLELRRASLGEGWLGLHPWLPRFLEREAEAERGVPRGERDLQPRLPTLLSTSVLQLGVEIVPTLDEAVFPVSSPEIEDALRRSLGLVFESAGDERWAVLRSKSLVELQAIGLSLSIDVLWGGEVVERARLHPTRQDERAYWELDVCGIELPSIPPGLEQDAESRRGWSLRVHGTDFEILRSWADRRWAGTLDLTLDELIERGASGEPR